MNSKFAAGCVLSGVLGALIALSLSDTASRWSAEAQERTADRGPTLRPPVTSSPAANSAPRATEPAPEQVAVLGPDELSREEQINIAVYDSANRGVVHITTRGVRGERFFLLEVPTEGTGSGSVVDKAGHILTNYHVIEGARQVQATLADGQSYEAKFVGADQLNDVAVIKIDAPAASLHPITLGDSRKLRVGMRVFAIGNPFGLERTLTTGIISSLNRSLQLHESFTVKSIIQIDAAINPGNSGGPLLDSHGKLIGMNTAIASKTGQSAGVGFALPVSIIARVVPQLVERGRVVRPEIGIAKVYETERGLLVYKMTPGGPAERAGLREAQLVTRRRGPFQVQSIDHTTADLIIAVDDQKVMSADDFLSVIEAKNPGSKVELTIVRQGKELRIPVTLSSGDELVPNPPRTKT